MGKNLIEACMNPVRQRILQYLAVHGSGTPGQIGQELSDIPKASLYRHIKVLLDADVITVTSQRTVRGTVERTYAPAVHSADEYSGQDMGLMVQSALMVLASSFAGYFAGDDPDPVKDMLSVSGASLLMSDSEFLELFGKFNQLLIEAAQNKPRPDRKVRTITLVSSPERK